jgi:hypothetical protein
MGEEASEPNKKGNGEGALLRFSALVGLEEDNAETDAGFLAVAEVETGLCFLGGL